MSTRIDLPGHRSPAVGLESPFEMLVACHERVQRSLDLLRRLQQHLRDKGHDEDAAQAARDVMRYFDLAAPLHHQDEELHIFPPLLAAAAPDVRAVVRRLMQDHVAMEAAWTQARAVLAGIAEPGTAGAALTAAQTDALVRFAALYQQHIADEEGLVYPAAQSLLTPDDVRAMSLDMAQRRGAA
ncbi:MAG: hemerythrin domain-containing protein [Burkholderiales bacterium]